MKNILVAIDGSETSNQALVEARELAECRGSKIKIIHVRDQFVLPTTILSSEQAKSYENLGKFGEEQSKLLLENALKTFQGFSGEVTTVSRMGDAGEEIIKEAKEGNHDLIIIGNRGLGVFSKKLLGSVSNKVLNYSEKRVLVIK